MEIQVAKDDLFTLRSEVYDRLRALEETPAAKSNDPIVQRAVVPQIKVLTKFVQKLNRACVKAYGHDCGAYCYPLKFKP